MVSVNVGLRDVHPLAPLDIRVEEIEDRRHPARIEGGIRLPGEIHALA